MPATAAWLASTEALLNRCIDSSAQAATIARRLQGTSLQVDIEGMTRIRATAHHGRLALLAGDDSAADAAISGSLPALLQLFKGGVNREPGTPAARIPVRPARARLCTPRAAHGRREHRRISARGRPRPRE